VSSKTAQTVQSMAQPRYNLISAPCIIQCFNTEYACIPDPWVFCCIDNKQTVSP